MYICIYIYILRKQNSREMSAMYIYIYYIDGLVQERRKSIANALELRLSCTNPSLSIYINIYIYYKQHVFLVYQGSPVEIVKGFAAAGWLQMLK